MVPLFQKLICTQKYAIGTSETVLIREVSLETVLIREVSLETVLIREVSLETVLIREVSLETVLIREVSLEAVLIREVSFKRGSTVISFVQTWLQCFSLVCGDSSIPPGTIIVEYLCDKER